MDIRHLRIAQQAHQLAVKCTQRCLDKPDLPPGIIRELKDSLRDSKKKLRQTNAAIRASNYLNIK